FKLPEITTAQGDLSRTLQLYAAAMEDCTNAIRLTPKDADAYDNRGWAYFHLGKAETARGHIEKAADLYEKAIEDYTHAIKLNPEHPYAYRNRANAKFRLGNLLSGNH
ncbi:tetratricopeptide repeat protein, partial [Candidatus Poribacteria bacterium]|nr:tetratricopeptide repeat protein [Candidatus Poribacteria bacterium]